MLKRLAAALLVASNLALPASVSAGPRVTIATEGAFLPWNGLGADGRPVGFEVDLARDLCARAALSCEVVARPWVELLPGLQTGQHDAVMAGMSITPEREAVADFLGPYAADPTALVVAPGSPLLTLGLPSGRFDLASIDSADAGALAALASALKGLVVGVQVGTVQAALVALHLPGVAVRVYPTTDAAALDLVAGRLGAVLAPLSTVAPLSALSGAELVTVGPSFSRGPLGAGVGVAVRKGDGEVSEALGAALASALADGTVSRLSVRWFGYDVATSAPVGVAPAEAVSSLWWWTLALLAGMLVAIMVLGRRTAKPDAGVAT